MKTTPTASLVLGATTLLGPGVPGGIGGLEPSDIHLLCTCMGTPFGFVALRQTDERYARVHDRRAASIVGGRMVAMLALSTISRSLWTVAVVWTISYVIRPFGYQMGKMGFST